MEPISFARGVPAPECLPVDELADCAAAVLARDGRVVLSYGPAGGYAPLREWIAERHGVDPGRVVLTNGSLEGFLFLARLLAPRGPVLVEAPTYDRPLKILASLERDLLVLEDDPYSLVRFEGESPPSVFELMDGEGVVYSSSFSKTVAPGLRVGYLVLPSELAPALEAAAAGAYITPVLLSQATVYEFLRREMLERNLRRVCDLLRTRRDAMLDTLDEELPGAERTSPAGGYFVWLDLPDGLATAELAAEGVTFVPGADFFPEGGGESAIRLAFSYVSPDEIGEGVRRLASAVRAGVSLRRSA